MSGTIQKKLKRRIIIVQRLCQSFKTLRKKESMQDGPLCKGDDEENSIDGLLDDDEEEELYVNHPHFLLNASMVPEPRADWSIADPSWDLNSSVIPTEYLQNFKRANQASPSFANQ